jgi:hypothetical protein
MVQTSEMWAKRSMLLKAIRCGAKRRSTVSKNQDFCLKPCSRPEQPGQRACQQPEKMSHRDRASPDSRLFATSTDDDDCGDQKKDIRSAAVAFVIFVVRQLLLFHRHLDQSAAPKSKRGVTEFNTPQVDCYHEHHIKSPRPWKSHLLVGTGSADPIDILVVKVHFDGWLDHGKIWRDVKITRRISTELSSRIISAQPAQSK